MRNYAMPKAVTPEVTVTQQKLLDILSDKAIHIDEIARQANLGIAQTSSDLANLVLQGKAQQVKGTMTYTKAVMPFLVGIFCGAGVCGLLHQHLTAGYWFSWHQFFSQLNHEDLIILCFVMGLTLLAIALTKVREEYNGNSEEVS